jgi:hypothetical protein
MASNFQVFLNQNRNSLHLHMFGDFDGISAYELINALSIPAILIKYMALVLMCSKKK